MGARLKLNLLTITRFNDDRELQLVLNKMLRRYSYSITAIEEVRIGQEEILQ